MSSPEQRPGPFQTNTSPVTAEWLDRQPRLATSEVQSKVTGMVQRSVRGVLGDALERDIINRFSLEVSVKDKAERGPHVIHLRYASTVGSIARAMGWDEGNSQLVLFCTGIYERLLLDAIAQQKKSMNDISAAEQSLAKLRIAKAQFMNDSLDEGQATEVDQLLGIFDIHDAKGEKRKKIYKKLRNPATRAEALIELASQKAVKEE
jgi:hypothetical protein